MTDVFISYARPDRPLAKQLAEVLGRSGWTVWWDMELIVGERFRDAIHRELSAAKCVVVLWSKASVQSDFVLGEAGEGKDRHVLVQALIEEVKPPLGFREIHYASLIGWHGSEETPGLNNLCEGISRHVRPSPTPGDASYSNTDGIRPPSSIPPATPRYVPSHLGRLILFVALAIAVAATARFWWINSQSVQLTYLNIENTRIEVWDAAKGIQEVRDGVPLPEPNQKFLAFNFVARNQGNTPAQVTNVQLEVEVPTGWEPRGLPGSPGIETKGASINDSRGFRVEPSGKVVRKYEYALNLSDEAFRRIQIEPTERDQLIAVDRILIRAGLTYNDMARTRETLRWCWQIDTAGGTEECDPRPPQK